jgi:AcrR family transcriptional regulator
MTSTRELLLDTTRRLLTEQGVEGLSLREIARRAGVSHGAPLRHFNGLASLLSAVAADAFRSLYDHVEATTSEAGDDPIARLRAAGYGYIGFATTNPGPFALMFRHDLCDYDDPDLTKAGGESFQQLVDLVTAAQGAGWHPGDDPVALAGVVWSAVHGLAVLWNQGSFGHTDLRLDAQIELLHSFLLPAQTTKRGKKR